MRCRAWLTSCVVLPKLHSLLPATAAQQSFRLPSYCQPQLLQGKKALPTVTLFGASPTFKGEASDRDASECCTLSTSSFANIWRGPSHSTPERSVVNLVAPFAAQVGVVLPGTVPAS